MVISNCNSRSRRRLRPGVAYILSLETLEPRLLLSGDGIDIEKFVYVEPVSGGC